MIEIFVLVSLAVVAALLAKGDVHCGRIIVSGSWVHCPFCGDPLAGAKATKVKSVGKAKSKQNVMVPMNPTRIAGKTHFLEPAPHDLQMTAHLKTPCLHVASRGKPKGQQCRLALHQDGRHRY